MGWSSRSNIFVVDHHLLSGSCGNLLPFRCCQEYHHVRPQTWPDVPSDGLSSVRKEDSSSLRVQTELGLSTSRLLTRKDISHLAQVRTFLHCLVSFCVNPSADMLGFKLANPARENAATQKTRPIYLDMQVREECGGGSRVLTILRLLPRLIPGFLMQCYPILPTSTVILTVAPMHMDGKLNKRLRMRARRVSSLILVALSHRRL